MTSLKIVGVFGVVFVLMTLITFALPTSFELAEVNRAAKVDRLSSPCPTRIVGPRIAYGPQCK
jgi:hypothetical protein